MKVKELERLLIRNGFQYDRGNKHAIWKKGTITVALPRHTELNWFTAKSILKKAQISL